MQNRVDNQPQDGPLRDALSTFSFSADRLARPKPGSSDPKMPLEDGIARDQPQGSFGKPQKSLLSTSLRFILGNPGYFASPPARAFCSYVIGVSVFDLLAGLLDRIAARPLGASRIVKPRKIRIEASSFCQLRCPSCPTTGGHIHPAIGSGFLKFENFRELLDAAPTLERVELSNYGEVFLNPQLLQILEYAHRKGVAITIENGANLNALREDVLEGLIKYRVLTITCSIDGATDESYRKYRVRGNFEKVIRNIEMINSHKRRYQSNLPHLRWQFVVFGHNEHEIPIAREMAQKLGMEFYTKLTWDPHFSPIRDVEFVHSHTGWRSTTRQEYEREHGEKYASETCHQLWDDPQINWDGKVIGCCRNFWGDFGGNAFTDGLLNGINNKVIKYAREMLSGRKPPRTGIPCSTCEIYIARRKSGRFINKE
jgi:MoaA/NifB/PqqE/SkfB family radical SAM enzyme